MSYAIIAHAKYKIYALNGLYLHIERKKENYNNKEINTNLSKYNYSIKSPKITYYKSLKKFKDEENLQYKIKSNTNIACEYVITSDKEFFENIGPIESKRFFKDSYNFVCNYKNLGEKYILSAIVHMDETTPHMHLIYLPVTHTKDKNNNFINKISCSAFWQEKNSYKFLQDDFYDYITSRGFNLKRGNSQKANHLKIDDFKLLTNYNKIKEVINTTKLEDLNTKSLDIAIEKNKELLKYCHKLETYCISSFNIITKFSNYELELNKLKKENKSLKNKLTNLTNYLKNIIKTITNHFKISKLDLIELIKQGPIK